MQQTVATTMLSFSCCFVNCRASFYVISRWRFARDCWNLSLLLGVNVQLAQHHQGKGKGKGNGEREGRSAAREKGERARSSLRLSGRQVDWARSARGGGGQVARVKCQNSFRWWCKTENEMRPPCKKKGKAEAGAGAAVGIITFAWSVRKQGLHRAPSALQSHPINDQLNSLTAKGSSGWPTWVQSSASQNEGGGLEECGVGGGDTLHMAWRKHFPSNCSWFLLFFDNASPTRSPTRGSLPSAMHRLHVSPQVASLCFALL